MQDNPQLAGRKVACPKCGASFVVPASASGVAVTPAAAAAAPAAPTAPGDAFSSISSAARGKIVRGAQRRLKRSNSALDLLDWRFEKYLTPWIVRVTWIVVLTLSAIWLLLLTIGLAASMLPQGSGETVTRSSSDSSYTVRSFGTPRSGASAYVIRNTVAVMTYVTALFGLALFLLWVRVMLESLIVLFNIAESLNTIDSRIVKATEREEN